MSTTPEKNRPGRKPLSPEQKLTGRLAMHTYPDVEEKAHRMGMEALEVAIRKEPKEGGEA